MHQKANRPAGGTAGAAGCDLKQERNRFSLSAAKPQARWRINAADAWRRLRRYIPDEPHRPRPADIERMCAELPYGYWRDASGRVVVFNRRYTPLWQRRADGTVERANAGEWVKWTTQRWFDYTDARYERTARERLRKILQDFFDGKDLGPHTIVTEWDFDEEGRP